MKFFRRILFYALLALMGCAIFCAYFYSPDWLHGSIHYAFVGSAVGLLVWSAIFLRVEPTLARIAIGINGLWIAFSFELVGS